ncbi:MULTISPECIES: hypothetical protein [unclassified Endozoicomonas]|uniref:hypothetical protein n=1 Tax=unclassified Endozoicomonas TaxID=2644528 RepID=UPI003BB58F06
MSCEIKKISTSALAKQRGLVSKDFFQILLSEELIERKDDAWHLTEAGLQYGGENKTSPKYGNYIVWPENLELPGSDSSTEQQSSPGKLLTASAVAKQVELSAQRVNALFSELGWIKKALKGWEITPQGKAINGVQKEDYRSGVPYVSWPESILENKAFMLSLKEVKGEHDDSSEVTTTSEQVSFREKFPATLRTADGHMVRSKAEMLIDNWLYMAEIVHAYERKLPIEEDMYCDFYIPTGKVYIEYWGYENDDKYIARKKQKIELYNKYGFHLIQLNDDDVKNLDDVLPRMLLKYGVQTY